MASSNSPHLTDRALPGALAALALAFALWYAVFETDITGNFWIRITLAALLLASLSLAAMGDARAAFRNLRLRDVAIGVGSAVGLYGVFALGRLVLTALFPGAEGEIGQVYEPRGESSVWLIGALLLLVTGPSEEIFWRGFLQRVLMQRFGLASGWILATLAYTLVHIWTLNVPLLLAAFVAGAIWGGIYLLEGRLWPVMISHAVWGVAIFAVAPLA